MQVMHSNSKSNTTLGPPPIQNVLMQVIDQATQEINTSDNKEINRKCANVVMLGATATCSKRSLPKLPNILIIPKMTKQEAHVINSKSSGSTIAPMNIILNNKKLMVLSRKLCSSINRNSPRKKLQTRLKNNKTTAKIKFALTNKDMREACAASTPQSKMLALAFGEDIMCCAR